MTDRKTRFKANLKMFKKSIPLYIIMLIPLTVFFITRYAPMDGLQIAFKDYRAVDGIDGSPWVGFKHFLRFIDSYNFWQIMWNTISLSFYQLLVGFPFPIILALSLNTIKNGRFKKSIQLITYAPHFISVVVMCGLILQMLSPRTGIINNIIVMLGGPEINFMGEPDLFSSIYVWSGIWQSTGWGTIIYLASLSSVDSQMHEAAIIDGASLFQRVINIDLMTILPMVITMLIVNVGSMLQVGFQKVLLLQTPLNLSASEVIQTYVYKIGLASPVPDFSYSTAIGLFTGIINFILIVTVNKIARKLGDTSLW